MLETLVNILAIVGIVAVGGVVVVFLGNLMLSAFGKNQKGVFFNNQNKVKKNEESSQRPVLLDPGQALDINRAPLMENSQILTGEARAARLEELLGSIKPQANLGIDDAAAEREKLLADKRMANNEFELDDEFDFDSDDDSNVKDQLLKHLKNDNVSDVARSSSSSARKTLAELEQEAIEENKLRAKNMFNKPSGVKDEFEFDLDDEDDEIDDLEADLEDEDEDEAEDDFLKEFKLKHSMSQNAQKNIDTAKVVPVLVSVPEQKPEDTQKTDTLAKAKKEEAEKIKHELEEELAVLKAEKKALEKEKAAKIETEAKETEKLKKELATQQVLAEAEKQKLNCAVIKLEEEKKAALKTNKTNEDSIKKQTEELRKNLKKMEELKNQLESEMAKTQAEKLKLEEERLSLETEKAAMLSKKKADEDDTSKLKKVMSFGFASAETYEKHIADLLERLKANEKELKRTKKEYIPLDKVRRTLENDKKKLRTKEAIVAKKKVMLYGVNNYVDINDERAKELSKELDLLEGLRLSVQNCEEVLQKNRDRLPILEANYNLLKDRDEDFKREIAEYENALELFRNKK